MVVNKYPMFGNHTVRNFIRSMDFKAKGRG